MNEFDLKARELVIKIQFQKTVLMFDVAKNIALIFVDEMLNCETNVMVVQNQRKHFDYWEKVKESITKL
jgi:hypothetical protein